jgi:hypothetical protein
MLGTLGGALEARPIDASNGKLVGEVTGEVEEEDGVLVIRRIRLSMRLVASEQARKTVERRARPIRHAMPALPHIAQDDRAHFVFHPQRTVSVTEVQILVERFTVQTALPRSG